MAREIELKLPLTQSQYNFIYNFLLGKEKINGLEILNTPPLESIEKFDEYYSLYNTREESRVAGEPQVIRLRSEKISLLYETDSPTEKNFSENSLFNEKSFFCIKRKSVKNGVEFNEENETFVENPDVIRDLLLFSGYHKFFQKKKNALSAYCLLPEILLSSFHLELERVNGLKYIEVEVTEEKESPTKVRFALEKFISFFSLDPSKRDSRSWMEILSSTK